MSLKVFLSGFLINCRRIYLRLNWQKEEKKFFILAQLFRRFMAPLSMEHSVHSSLFCSLFQPHEDEPQKNIKFSFLLVNAHEAP